MDNVNKIIIPLYEDNHLLILVKPAGILTQSDISGDWSLLEAAKLYVKEKYAKPGDVFLGLVHRLDRPVSGVICFARTGKAAARLCEQFRTRSPEKIYRAVVEGHLPQRSGKLSNWLAFEEGAVRRTRVLKSEVKGAKRGELLYTVIDESSRRQLVEITLLTGYKHQIRAQLAGAGAPVVGDYKYANTAGENIQKLEDGRAVALHAYSLSLEHPTKKERLTFTAPLPAYWPAL